MLPRLLRALPRAQLRAALIAYFVLFSVLGALPTLGTASPERLLGAFEQGELRRWVGLFESFGVQLTAERLTQIYLELSSRLAQVRAIVLLPIEGWLSLTLTAQSWRLFGTPDEVRSVLRISGFAAAPEAVEQVLYESGNPERRWYAELLEYRRIRALYNPSHAGPPPTYEGLGQRLSRELFAERPDVQRVRIWIDQSRIAGPGERSSAAAQGTAHEERYVLEFWRPPA